MTKGNNAIPKVHQRKHWTPGSSQSGNYKTFLDQPKKAQTRRRLRLQKAKKCFPRPLRNLKPTVHCPTVRYNMRQRLGRGFTCEELKAADIKPRYAATIGISVDIRRKNISEESLKANTERLKTYKSKLTVFPLGKPADKAAKQAVNPGVVAVKAAPTTRKVAKADVEKSAYKFLKKNMSAARYLGERMVRQQKKEAKAKAEAEKKAKK